MQLTRTHRVLIGLVVAGAAIIAAIGFAGSYAAVRELALEKGFGNFSLVFPIGIDAGICVLLALDLLLTWLRIPFPLLRQTAWLLTAATIAFNGAAAWPDPLGTGMHAVIPILFVVAVEAARHAVGRIADITADKHMEGVRLTRWLLSPVPTFKLWRRMKLWELRSYEQVIKLEQDRLIYQARLQARFGRGWRRKAPIEALMPLRLAKYGVPLAETAPAGLAAAGIEPVLLPPAPKPELAPGDFTEHAQGTERRQDGAPHPQQRDLPPRAALPQQRNDGARGGYVQGGYVQDDVPPDVYPQDPYPQGPYPQDTVQQERGDWVPVDPDPEAQGSPWFAKPPSDQEYQGGYDPDYEDVERTPAQVPLGPGGRTRSLGNVGTIGAVPQQRGAQQQADADEDAREAVQEAEETVREAERAERAASAEPETAEDAEYAEIAYQVFRTFVSTNSGYPSIDVLAIHLADGQNVHHPRSAALLRRLMPEFKQRYDAELAADHIA
ncbi:DUF2637 domain-containing protein [Streptomyces sp. NBC_00102]|uniref:DUF2637 domain-containing protein n=1 Tax=Streptomyces sp. NBC_00102 TaxID=2975652 RepID=UPI0022559C10|nr:DUF2637 domain-containing protein [Streptomyces sp. NBC_00102]MCX5398850.1 DUF2637 domain-containing protein [Streptomyces sp. NBC_00102]